MNDKFKDNLKYYTSVINKYIESIKYTDIYANKLYESMEYSMSGGKKIRPILILATYNLFKDNLNECLPYCMSMEMIHNFSLIHDDMPCIDNDDLRHNKLTNHKKYGEYTALLAGDMLLNKAYENILCLDSFNSYALKELSIGTSNMIKGEYIDIIFENTDISYDQLKYMHLNKTGALIRASVRIGAILANCNNNELNILTKFGEDIGLAFQIKDDILSKIGDSKKTGKPVGNDEELNKSTYIKIVGLDKSINLLDNIIKNAIDSLKVFGNKANFLIDLAIYIKEREK
ncbi:MAG: polyprenyl synthetase family protein [Clostridia bacterium]